MHKVLTDRRKGKKWQKSIKKQFKKYLEEWRKVSTFALAFENEPQRWDKGQGQTGLKPVNFLTEFCQIKNKQYLCKVFRSRKMSDKESNENIEKFTIRRSSTREGYLLKKQITSLSISKPSNNPAKIYSILLKQINTLLLILF